MIDIILLFLTLGGVLTFILGFFNLSDELKNTLSFILAAVSTLVVSILALLFLPSKDGEVTSRIGNWITVGDLHVEFSYYLDTWSIILVSLSSFLTFLIVVFSNNYIKHDSHTPRYYSLIQFFLLGMILLVTSNYLPILFLGWEIVGLCSYSLISYYYHKTQDREKVIAAGQKALLVTSFADIGLFVAIATIIHQGLPLNLDQLLLTTTYNWLILGGLLLASMGKSAQFPLHFWIASRDDEGIDAMQGPTTVSALIHAATMVNAGIYLLSRAVTISSSQEFLVFIAAVGALTALLSSLAAIVVKDLKRVLAYSTISQLGYMVAALSIHDTGSMRSLFHLINHAFFKGLLFLLAAVLIHQSGSRLLVDLRGVAKRSNLLIATTVIGLGSLAGIPPFSGFFSKELIIEGLWHVDETRWIAVLLIIASIGTAIYVGRLGHYLLTGENQEATTPFLHKVVLLVLGLFTLGSTLTFYVLENISGSFETPSHIIEIGFLTIGVPILVGLGLVAGFYHEKVSLPDWLTHIIRQGYGIEALLTNIGNTIVNTGTELSVRMQTGKFYWNMFLFVTSSAILMSALYFLQFGGLL